MLEVGVSLLSVVRLEMVFEGTYEVFKILRDVRCAIWAKDTAMCVFVVFMTLEECFGIAELNSGIGVELKPRTKEARLCVLHKFA